MKPTIKNRLANIIAKLAGSPDYESGIEPKTPIEFYLNEAVDKILDGEIGTVRTHHRKFIRRTLYPPSGLRFPIRV